MMERHHEIENVIITEYKEKLYDPFLKAIDEYKLVEENDHICCCISGGKDSMIMAKLFQELEKNKSFSFKVTYLVMNPGYNKKNLDMILHNLDLLKIPAEVVCTDIFEIANMQTKSPCYLCAKMRRGALYKFAKERNCNKIALGHHYDDVIVTTLMNMLNTGSFQTMLPKLHSTNNEGMELIRPLYLIREEDIIEFKDNNGLEFIQCACKFTEETHNDKTSSQRAETKKLIYELRKTYPDIEANLFSSACNVNLDKIISYKIGEEKINLIKDYKDKK